MSEVLEAMHRTWIVAIVRLDQYGQAVEVTRALTVGGITVIELTHTSTGVDDAVIAARAALGDHAQIWHQSAKNSHNPYKPDDWQAIIKAATELP